MANAKRALISVSDKSGIVEFAEKLASLNIEIISTGGTSQLLKEAKIPVKNISEVTGVPEILDGRVKTLHPKIHGGLLARRDVSSHLEQLEENGIRPIDMVIVNLYPFQKTIENPGATVEEAIENIDIGGPSMLRSAAKNHRDVTVVTDPEDYDRVYQELLQQGNTSLTTRRYLAAKAFNHTAYYDAIIAGYFNQLLDNPFPEQLTMTFTKEKSLRYGENPHQKAAFYKKTFDINSNTLATAKQLNGKELSYNNLNDANAALELVREFKQPAVVAIKHMNPCGVGLGSNLFEAYQKAYEADPVSIFGGIVATNQTVDAKTAAEMKKIFLEIILAPSFTEEALQILKTKKNLRLLTVEEAVLTQANVPLKLQSIDGGLLVQEEDLKSLKKEECKTVTDRAPTEEEWEQLLFAWKVVKHVKSNAIVLAKDFRTLGVGAGQMNRVGAAKIAIEQAGESTKGSVLASDAFFPMKDTLQLAAEAGVTAIIQPGGSIRDEESVDEANKHGIAMVFTGIRHFKH